MRRAPDRDPISLGVLWPGALEFSTYVPPAEVLAKVAKEEARHRARLGQRQPEPPARRPSGPFPAPPASQEARSLADRLADARAALSGSVEADRARQEARALRPELEASARTLGKRPPQGDPDDVQARAERIKRELGL